MRNLAVVIAFVVFSCLLLMNLMSGGVNNVNNVGAPILGVPTEQHLQTVAQLRDRIRALEHQLSESSHHQPQQQQQQGGGRGGSDPVVVHSIQSENGGAEEATREDGGPASLLSTVKIMGSDTAVDAKGNKLKSFKQIGDSLRDDKTHKHRYDIPYSMYLEAHRLEPLHVLEIGLGCDQERIGASVLLWEQYLPHARLTMIEYDEKCGRKWEKEYKGRGPSGGISFYYGDQADKKFLADVLAKEGHKKYDMIIDDGGHKMHQQIASFEALWNAVKRGGFYVIEDINTAFKTRYGGSKRPNCTGETSTNLVKQLTDRVHALPVKGHPGKYIEDTLFKSPIARVDCHHFICFISKR